MKIDLTISSDDEDYSSISRNEEDSLVIINNVPLTLYHYNILLHSHLWVTDEIINAFSHILCQVYDNVHCCSTFFFTHLMGYQRSYDERIWIQKWEKSINWINKEKIFIPINWSNSHWALCVLDIKDGKLSYYDSIESKSRSKKALNIIQRALSHLKIITKPLISYCPLGQIQQFDGSSCGIFVCWRMVKIVKFFNRSESGSPSEFRGAMRNIIFSNK